MPGFVSTLYPDVVRSRGSVYVSTITICRMCMIYTSQVSPNPLVCAVQVRAIMMCPTYAKFTLGGLSMGTSVSWEAQTTTSFIVCSPIVMLYVCACTCTTCSKAFCACAIWPDRLIPETAVLQKHLDDAIRYPKR